MAGDSRRRIAIRARQLPYRSLKPCGTGSLQWERRLSSTDRGSHVSQDRDANRASMSRRLSSTDSSQGLRAVDRRRRASTGRRLSSTDRSAGKGIKDVETTLQWGRRLSSTDRSSSSRSTAGVGSFNRTADSRRRTGGHVHERDAGLEASMGPPTLVDGQFFPKFLNNYSYLSSARRAPALPNT